MIYICADDFALCTESSEHILDCIKKGALNKVSAFPGADTDLYRELPPDTPLSLHINLVDGKCMANPEEIDLIADKDGRFIHSFAGLAHLWIFKRKKFEAQIYKEIRAQILFWKNHIGTDRPFLVDTHQHTHMIPSVFRMLLKLIEEENLNLKYLRIPAEPILPFVKTPSLYFSYSPVNLVKQWLLKFLWLINKPVAKKYNIPTAIFFGILFSGNMDFKRVEKVFPEFIKLAKKRNMNLEVLFHPGYVSGNEISSEIANAKFKNFYLSDKRKDEFDTVMKISSEEV